MTRTGTGASARAGEVKRRAATYSVMPAMTSKTVTIANSLSGEEKSHLYTTVSTIIPSYKGHV